MGSTCTNCGFEVDVLFPPTRNGPKSRREAGTRPTLSLGQRGRAYRLRFQSHLKVAIDRIQQLRAGSFYLLLKAPSYVAMLLLVLSLLTALTGVFLALPVIIIGWLSFLSHLSWWIILPAGIVVSVCCRTAVQTDWGNTSTAERTLRWLGNAIFWVIAISTLIQIYVTLWPLFMDRWSHQWFTFKTSNWEDFVEPATQSMLAICWALLPVLIVTALLLGWIGNVVMAAARRLRLVPVVSLPLDVVKQALPRLDLQDWQIPVHNKETQGKADESVPDSVEGGFEQSVVELDVQAAMPESRDTLRARVILRLAPPKFLSNDQRQRALARFLESAYTQKAVADESDFWAPIYSIRSTATDASIETDYFAGSVKWLIDLKIRPSHADMYQVARAISIGLLDLKNKRRRGHGDLTVSRILLKHTKSPSQNCVVLDRPAPDSTLAESVQSRDLFQAGLILYQLASGSLYREGWSEFPVKLQRNPLGRHARKWATLCNQLLNPDPSLRLQNLDKFKRQVDHLRPWSVVPFNLI